MMSIVLPGAAYHAAIARTGATIQRVEIAADGLHAGYAILSLEIDQAEALAREMLELVHELRGEDYPRVVQARGVSLEWHCPHAGTIRLHTSTEDAYGTAYARACTVVRQDDAAILYGLERAPSVERIRDMAEVLRQSGCRRVRYERRKPGREPRWAEFAIPDAKAWA